MSPHAAADFDGGTDATDLDVPDDPAAADDLAPDDDALDTDEDTGLDADEDTDLDAEDDDEDGAVDPARFTDLPLRPELLRVLASLGYEEPTPIQWEAIPPMVDGSDLLGQAATGTGKTAAFALPILQRLTAGRTEPEPMALVLVPTRELAMQVAQAVHRYGRELDARVVPIYGGQPIGRQLRALDEGVDVVVATPGRILDHLRRGSLSLHRLETVVLDEADEMLDMGFAEELDAILDATPKTRQTVLFSATMPTRIDAIAERHLRAPLRIQIGTEATEPGEAPLVRQVAYLVARPYKPAALGRVLDVHAPTAALVFCRTREEVDELTETLNKRGYRAEALHGGMGQEQRDRVMGRLRAGTADLLVATDVAARGLDVEQLSHVVNYNVPTAPESYVHRIGRVGRAGREGVAITLAEPREQRMITSIERVIGQRIAVEPVPTVADLNAKRLEVTTAALRESLATGELARFQAVVDGLAGEFGLAEVAMAAVRLAHAASGGVADDEEEIPQVQVGRRGARRDAPGGPVGGVRPPREPQGWHAPAPGMTRLFVGAGHRAGIRPQDLVGAIAGEAGLTGRDIGAIQITDRFALVEVPHGEADRVIDALRNAKIKGKKAIVRRDRAPIDQSDHRPHRRQEGTGYRRQEHGGFRGGRQEHPGHRRQEAAPTGQRRSGTSITKGASGAKSKLLREHPTPWER